MTAAYIGLGSNLGEPEKQLRAAVRAIARLPGSRIAAVSRVYHSAAVGPGEQPDYLNAALRLETSLAPEELLAALQRIEADQGRVRTERWGPRTLDLDILLYGEQLISTESLTIPHPSLAVRNFVLQPLRDVTGGKLVLPGGTDLDTLLSGCPGGVLAHAGLDLETDAMGCPVTRKESEGPA